MNIIDEAMERLIVTNPEGGNQRGATVFSDGTYAASKEVIRAAIEHAVRRCSEVARDAGEDKSILSDAEAHYERVRKEHCNRAAREILRAAGLEDA